MKKIPSLLEMELAVSRMFDPRKNIIIPNISWGFDVHECDLLVIKPSGYCIEVEIKRSKSDLIADKKKGHNHDSKKISELYYAIPGDIYDECLPHIPEEAGVIRVQFYEGRNWWYASQTRPAVAKTRTKLTDAQIQKASRLGVMRIWSLKETIRHLKAQKDEMALDLKIRKDWIIQ